VLSRVARSCALNADQKCEREGRVESLCYNPPTMLETVRGKPNVGRQMRTRQRQFTNAKR